MSEIHDSELVEVSSAATGDGSPRLRLSEPSLNPILSPEASDGFLHVESSADGIQNDVVASENQDSGSSAVVTDHNGVLRGDEDEPKVTEDPGKEDMFVDCPDELISNADIKEVVVAAEMEENSEEKLNLHETNGAQDGFEADEVESLRALLDKTVREKESVSIGYREEREAFARDLASLRQQLKALIIRQPLLDESGNQDYEDRTLEIDTSVPLDEVMNECSRIVKSACEERLLTETTIRELNATLLSKNQEIEELNAKVSEFPVSQIEMVTNRLLAYFTGVVDPQELLDDSINGKLVFVEKGTYMLAERYNMILSETEQLRQCLSGSRLDGGLLEFWTIFGAARDELLELKRKELDFVEKLTHLENESTKLVQELDDQKMMVERVNAELGKTKTELEQEKMRCGNAKEKLTMAVTKGKALVQQRDSLKHSLAEKTSELDKCLIELQEKSSALEAAELRKEELLRSENLVASFQETLSRRDAELEKLEEMLSQSCVPDELLSMDVVERCRWLIDENNKLKGLSVDFQKLNDALSMIDFPESVSSSELDSQVHWVRESLYQAKSELNIMHDEIVTTREAAQEQIDRLTASLSAEFQVKDYLQTELDDLTSKYKEIVEKEHQVSLEKDHVVKMILEASGTALDDDGVCQPSSDIGTLIERCFGKMREQNTASFGSSYVDVELFEKVKNYLYARTQELMLYELVLEEEMLIRSQVNNLSNELGIVSQELGALKEEKESLLKDLERSEEKSALLREKLSMAVKKGKGLFQDRESLKLQLDEKKSEIEKLRLQSQQQESELVDHKEQIRILSADMERIPKLEMDLSAIKEQRDQLEKFLLESNNMLQRVIESIDGIVLPVVSVFDEPTEKVKWLAGYINECQDAKALAENDLARVKEEASTLSSKLIEAETTIKSLEDALSVAEGDKSRISEEKREIELAKDNVEQELQKAREEASLHTSKFVEESQSKKSLEEALSLAENNISSIISEKESALVSRAAAETELEQVKEEVAIQTSKLTEAYKTIKSLEDALSQAQTNVTLRNEQHSDAQVHRTSLENELKKLQEEAGSLASKEENALVTIKSLEDALLKAENNVSVLEVEKKNAEEEILTLNSKLNACVEELAGTNGSLESRSAELTGYIYDLQVLMKDDTLLSIVKGLAKKFDTIKNIDTLVEDIRNHFVGLGLEELQKHDIVEENLHVTKSTTDIVDNIFSLDKDYGEVGVADGDRILSFRETVEGFQSRNKVLAENFGRFSSSMDEFIAALLRKVQATRGEVPVVYEHIESLKQKVNSLEMYKHKQDNSIALLENDVMTLLSACTDATRELQFQVKNNLLELSSLPNRESLRHGFFQEIREISVPGQEDQRSVEANKCGKAAEILLLAARRVQALCKNFESTTNVAATIILDLQNNLKEARTSSEKAIEESNLKQNMVSELEADVEALQKSCSELKLVIEDYQAKEVKLKEREAELVSFNNSLLMKEQEAEDSLLSASQIKILFDKIREIEIPLVEYEVDYSEPQNSSHVKKLFYIVNNVPDLQNQMISLSGEKEKLQSTLAAHTLEIQRLEEEIGKHARDEQATEKMKNELSELIFGLEKIIRMLGGDGLVGDQNSSGVGLVGDQNSSGVKGPLSALEKQVTALLLEYESSKSKAQDLGSKLVGSQKVVDELSSKIKLLEDSLQDRGTEPEIIQERSIYEAPSLPTGPEISEIEDAGSLGKKTISPVPSAAHVRTMRKGSTDHLALDIDLESNRLINNAETDEDKGHVFKSLNTSGLVPRQGKMIADRIDGIWVSGGRVLMSRPKARLGVIAYCLLLHIWLVGTIL